MKIDQSSGWTIALNRTEFEALWDLVWSVKTYRSKEQAEYLTEEDYAFAEAFLQASNESYQ